MSSNTFGVELEALPPKKYFDPWRTEVLENLCSDIRGSLAQYNVPALADIVQSSDYNKWIVKFDGSCGVEVTSTPLTWDTAWHLDVVTGAMWRHGCRTNRSCGLHVHHLLDQLSVVQLENVWKHWAAFEHLIMAMVTPNRLNNQYNQLLLSYNRLLSFSGLCNQLKNHGFNYCVSDAGKYRTLNVNHWWRTGRIEVRAHHGTLRAADIKQWVMFTQRFLEASREGVSQEVLEQIAAKPVKGQLQELRTLLSLDNVDRLEEILSQVQALIQRRSPNALEVVNDSFSGYCGTTV